jgi:pantoate--beta-alanine ligase
MQTAILTVATGIAECRQEIAKLRQSAIAAGKTGTIGFIPTMGYLHEGHISLIKAAKSRNDLIVLSIFVNPLQFGPNEDFDKYPRDSKRDLAIAQEAGVDLVFMPEVSDMYPQPSKTKVSVSEVTSRLCGASRPTHFDGVSTVVSKLFNIVQPEQAYFGLKDAQQVAVIEQMVKDLNMPVEIVPCPILREADGLAMSSRNMYLSPEERQQALVLSASLRKAAQLAAEQSNSFPVDQIISLVSNQILTSALAEIDYVEALSYPTLEPLANVDPNRNHRILIAVAVKFGKTRLIDNTILELGK